MRYYKEYDGSGYLICIGEGLNGVEIDEDEYASLLALIRARPIPPEGKDYRLRADLTWEEYDLPPAPEPTDDEEISAEEALEIMTEGYV